MKLPPLPAAARWLLKLAVAALLLYYLFRLFRDNLDQLEVEELRLSVPLLLASYLLAAAYYGLNILSWHRLTRALGIALPAGESARVWLYSQLGKYLPGKLWLVVGRLEAYRRWGHPRSRVGAGFVLEMALRFLAGIFLFLITWGAAAAPATRAPLLALALGLAAGLLLLLHPRILERLLNLALALLRRERLSLELGFGELARVFGLELAAWAVGATGLFLVLAPWVPFGAEGLPRLIGAVAISGVAGNLAVFVPSGLGVREGVLVTLLATSMSTSGAVVVSIVARLWVTSAELLLIGAVFVASRRRLRP